MNRKQAIDESIIHWEEMLEFAKSYKRHYSFLGDQMIKFGDCGRLMSLQLK